MKRVLVGMTQPQKVIGFLDFTGDWDPSLAFVMAGAIAFFAPLYFWTARRERVAFGQRFSAPAQGGVDARLIVGATMFGVGWGLGGYCPGPALTTLGSGTLEVLWFAGAMALGMALYPSIDRLWSRAAKLGKARVVSDSRLDPEV
jgi:hypothetical protein